MGHYIGLFEYLHQQEGKEIFTKVSSDSFFLTSHLFAGIQTGGENMGMDEDQDLWFFCLWIVIGVCFKRPYN